MSQPHVQPLIRLSFSAGTLLLQGISAASAARKLDASLWTRDPRVPAWRCDAIQYELARQQLEAARFRFADLVPAWETVRWGEVGLPVPSAEQQAAIDAWRGTRRGCIVMPTGTGKTEVALTLVAELAVSTLIVAPVRDLMYQWQRRILERLGYDAGIIGDNIFNVRPVSVTTYDSASIHMHRLGNQFQLLIFDECHHLPGPIRADAARMSAAPWRMGLTATPERSDGRHTELDALIGPILYRLPLSEVRGRTLAEYEVIRVPVHLSDEEQRQYDRLSQTVRHYIVERRKTAPNFSWEDLCAESGQTPEARLALKAYFARKSIEDRAEEKLRVLEDLFRLHQGERCIVFAGSNAMARDVSRRFLIPCLLNHCGKRERLEVLQGLQQGDYPALVANQVLDEGVDLPEVKVAVVIGGMASTRQAQQRLGRILRKSGNSQAVLYEIVCAGTKDEIRSRQRRKTDAYTGTRHRRL